MVTTLHMCSAFSKTRWLPKAGQVCTANMCPSPLYAMCVCVCVCVHGVLCYAVYMWCCYVIMIRNVAWDEGQGAETHAHTHTHTHNAYKGEGHVYAWDEGQGAEAIGKCVRMLAVRCESQAVSSS